MGDIKQNKRIEPTEAVTVPQYRSKWARNVLGQRVGAMRQRNSERMPKEAKQIGGGLFVPAPSLRIIPLNYGC